MKLTLKYPPHPENAPLFAEDIVDAARGISGVELDYTLESLARVDEILEGIHAEGVPEHAVAETLFGFGCYAGEVLVRQGAGRWESPGGEERQHMDAPFVVRFPNGVVANPVHRCFRRYRDGATESVGYFGRVMLAEAGRDRAAKPDG